MFTAGAVVVSLKSLRDQLWLQVFTDFTRRYADIVATLPSESRRPDGAFRLNDLSDERRFEIENAARAYLNLCSEEHYLYLRKRIDRETWAIWRKEMEDVFRLPWIRDCWPALKQEYESYPKFVRFVAECIEPRSNGDDDATGDAQSRPKTVDASQASDSA